MGWDGARLKHINVAMLLVTSEPGASSWTNGLHDMASMFREEVGRRLEYGEREEEKFEVFLLPKIMHEVLVHEHLARTGKKRVESSTNIGNHCCEAEIAVYNPKTGKRSILHRGAPQGFSSTTSLNDGICSAGQLDKSCPFEALS